MFGSRGMPGVGALVVLAIGVVLLLSGRGSDESGTDAPGDGERARATVTRVVDGDTIEVELEGAEEDVRYIGVDTPESVAPGQPVECYGERASALNRRLVEGERVLLVFDAERRDRYGRLLAYVYVDDLFVNARLVRAGFARTLAIAPNTDQARLFDRLARRAGTEARGLWGDCEV